METQGRLGTDSGEWTWSLPDADEEARGKSPRRSLESCFRLAISPGASLQLVTQRVPAALLSPATTPLTAPRL